MTDRVLLCQVTVPWSVTDTSGAVRDLEHGDVLRVLPKLAGGLRGIAILMTRNVYSGIPVVVPIAVFDRNTDFVDD